jgi:hypothetical protein
VITGEGGAVQGEVIQGIEEETMEEEGEEKTVEEQTQEVAEEGMKINSGLTPLRKITNSLRG